VSSRENRTGHSLIALLALRRAKAIKAREAAEKSNDDSPRPKKGSWFG
jgi:hypothetical protein